MSNVSRSEGFLKKLLAGGISDLVYLNHFFTILKDMGKEGLADDGTIVPVGGTDKIATFISLMPGNELSAACLLDACRDQGAEGRLKRMVEQKIIADKRRPVAFIGHGGSDWCSLNMPTQKLWAIPMGFNIVDELYFKWNVPLRTEDAKLERIFQCGKHVAECALSGSTEYIAEKGYCPCCHSNEFQISPDGRAECVTCGMPGKLRMTDGKVEIDFDPEDKKYSLITDAGRMQHLKDMLATGVKLRNMDRTEMDRRNEEMKAYLPPSKPE